MKLKLLFFCLFVLVARCMKKGFLLNKQKKEKSFVCDICIENRFVSFVPPCRHTMCGVCASQILHRQNLDDACAICRAKLSWVMKGYKVNFHNFDDLNPQEYLSASQSAIFEEKLSLLQKIVNLGFDVKPYPVLIVQAVENGLLQILKFLAEHKANLHVPIEEVNLVFVAADYGHFEIVKFLVDQGVDMNRRNSKGRTPILLALFHDFHKITKFLADRGAIMNQPQLPEINLELSECLYRAAQDGHFETVKFLVERGLDVDKENLIGATAILVAAAKGHLEIVKFLARNGADIDRADHNGATPLYHATYEGLFYVVEFLVGQGADVNKQHRSGATPIEVAIEMIDISASHRKVAIYFAILNIKIK